MLPKTSTACCVLYSVSSALQYQTKKHAPRLKAAQPYARMRWDVPSLVQSLGHLRTSPQSG